MESEKRGKVISFAAHKGKQDAEKTLKSQMALDPRKERKTSSLGGFKRKQKREKKARERMLKFKLFFQNMCYCHISDKKLKLCGSVFLLLMGSVFVTMAGSVMFGMPWIFCLGSVVGSLLLFGYVLYLLVKSGKQKYSHRSNCHHYTSTPPQPLKSA